MNYTFFLSFISLLFMHQEVKCQATRSDNPNSNLVVHLSVKGTEGRSRIKASGFVVSAFKDTVFIVTASHVFRTSSIINETGIDAYIKGKPYEAVLLFRHDSAKTDNAYDIALLKAYVPSITFKNSVAVTDPSACEELSFYKLNDSTALPFPESTTFEYWQGSKDLVYYVYSKAIVEGDSGSGLFCKDKLAGMIIGGNQGLGEAIAIRHIAHLLTNYLPANHQIEFIDNSSSNHEK